ncbi:MAG TPA: hypothetical protein VNS34_18265 [Rhizobiaceae bacterium]|nr:hypothetical protein [Rhizobiaceae bacterium]
MSTAVDSIDELPEHSVAARRLLSPRAAIGLHDRLSGIAQRTGEDVGREQLERPVSHSLIV